MCLLFAGWMRAGRKVTYLAAGDPEKDVENSAGAFDRLEAEMQRAGNGVRSVTC